MKKFILLVATATISMTVVSELTRFYGYHSDIIMPYWMILLAIFTLIYLAFDEFIK